MKATIQTEEGLIEVRRVQEIQVEGKSVQVVKEPVKDEYEPITQAYTGELNKVTE